MNETEMVHSCYDEEARDIALKIRKVFKIVRGPCG
jgi:hypothetical protein